MQALFLRDFFLANQNESHVGKAMTQEEEWVIQLNRKTAVSSLTPPSWNAQMFLRERKKNYRDLLQGPEGLYSSWWIFENLVWRPNVPRGESDISGEAHAALQPHSLSHEWLWLSHHWELSSIIPKINVVQRDEASSEGRAPLRLHGDRFPLGRRQDALYLLCSVKHEVLLSSKT